MENLRGIHNFDVMLDWFEKRTKKHIRLVRKYCRRINRHDRSRFAGILEKGRIHDDSKFKEPERDPYVLITWRYKCKKNNKNFADYVDEEELEEVKNRMLSASEHHIRHNPHHPEYHTRQKGEFVNRNDRDKPPGKVIDATKMGALDVAEMVADWCAMSDERGGDPIKWANENVNVRWKFTNEQKDLIYELIGKIW